MKLKYATLTLAALFGFLPVVSSPAQEKEEAEESSVKPDAETVKLVKDVIEASQVRATLEKSVGTMIEQGKKAAGPNADKLPPDFWTEVEKEFHKKLPELIDSMVPMYAKHFTKSELAALAEFYRSPAGKKFAEKQPAILQESMAAGSAWGEKIGRDVMQRLLNKKEAD